MGEKVKRYFLVTTITESYGEKGVGEEVGESVGVEIREYTTCEECGSTIKANGLKYCEDCRDEYDEDYEEEEDDDDDDGDYRAYDGYTRTVYSTGNEQEITEEEYHKYKAIIDAYYDLLYKANK